MTVTKKSLAHYLVQTLEDNHMDRQTLTIVERKSRTQLFHGDNLCSLGYTVSLQAVAASSHQKRFVLLL